MNELMQSATFEDRYQILEGEQKMDKWTRHLKVLVGKDKATTNLFKYVIERKVKVKQMKIFLNFHIKNWEKGKMSNVNNLMTKYPNIFLKIDRYHFKHLDKLSQSLFEIGRPN